MKVCPNCLNDITINSCACVYDDRTEIVPFSSNITRQKEEARQFYEYNLQFKFKPDINKKNG